MTEQPGHHEALIAAALAGELDAEGRRDLDAACAADPSLRRDLRELQELTQRLDDADLDWEEAEPPHGLLSEVLAATERADPEQGYRAGDRTAPESAGTAVASVSELVPGSTRSSHPRRSAPHTRRVLAGWAAAACLLVVGALGGSVITDALDAPPSGPPGTLGAVEELSFSSSPADTLVDAALVAHTWGTETVLEVDGLDVGEAFEVVLVREDGTEYVSGAFLGSEQTVTCRLNAAVMREDVSRLQIRDDTGAVVATSEVEHI